MLAPPFFFGYSVGMTRKYFALIALLLLPACSGGNAEGVDNESKPKSARQDRIESKGKLTGEGFTLMGPSEEKAAGASPLGVNSYLWRASLDTLSFMPLASADPFGGVIITDWYEDPKTPGERFKVNVLILDRTLRADGVKMTVFKQKMSGGAWRDQKVDETLARSLEDTVLTRARQLRVKQLGK